jgi:hypothetical protein
MVAHRQPHAAKCTTCCLEEVSAPSGETWPMRCPQVRSGAESGQSRDVRSSYGLWNDERNDRCGCLRSLRSRAPSVL